MYTIILLRFGTTQKRSFRPFVFLFFTITQLFERSTLNVYVSFYLQKYTFIHRYIIEIYIYYYRKHSLPDDKSNKDNHRSLTIARIRNEHSNMLRCLSLQHTRMCTRRSRTSDNDRERSSLYINVYIYTCIHTFDSIAADIKRKKWQVFKTTQLFEKSIPSNSEITLRHCHPSYICHFLLLFSTANVLWCDFRYATANHRPSGYFSSHGCPIVWKKHKFVTSYRNASRNCCKREKLILQE